MMFASLMVVCGLAFASPHVAMAQDEASVPVATEATSEDATGKVAEKHEKVATPLPKKWVLEDSTDKWVPAADRSLSESFSYRIDGCLQGDLFDYDPYQWWLVDTLAKGTDLVEDSVKVYLVRDGEILRELDEELEVSYKSGTLKVGTADIGGAIEGLKETDVIRVEYDVTPNELFHLGVFDPNDNYCHIDHTAPYTGEGLVSSPEARARAATWALVVEKVADAPAGTGEKTDADAGTKEKSASDGMAQESSATGVKALAGATFELSTLGGERLAQVVTDGNGRASVAGLDSGTYVLTETKAPEGYEKVSPITFEIVATWDDIELETLSVRAAKGVSASADAKAGKVLVRVSDPASEKPSSKTPSKNPDASTPKASSVTAARGTSGGTSGGGSPKTGDFTLDVVPFMLLGVGAAGVGLCARGRTNQGKDTSI